MGDARLMGPYLQLQRMLIAGTVVLVPLLSPMRAQIDDSQDSVASAARRTRAEKSADGHASAKRILNDENNPKANMVQRVQEYWATIPPSKLVVLIPSSSRPADHGVEVPLEKSSVYVPFAETTWASDFEGTAQQFFEMILTRSRFSGVRLKLGAREDSSVSGQSAFLVHFSFMFHGVGHQGVAMFISVPEQVVGFGCIYRSADWEKAQSICDQIVNSAEVAAPPDYKLFKKPFH